jgi:hypothetical protein
MIRSSSRAAERVLLGAAPGSGFTPTAGRSGMGGGELKGRAPYVLRSNR